MTELEEPKVKGLEKVVYSPMVKHQTDNTSEVLRIVNDEDFTRIDFITYASMFEWVQISKDTFIRPIGSTQKLKVVKIINIPITPAKYYFINRNDVLSYAY